jgi:predicted RNA-binding protein with EMAP domain
MEKYNQIKDELQKEIEAFKIIEMQQVKHIENIKQLKSNLKNVSESYIKCHDCKSLVKIGNIEAHKNTMKNIISSLPKSVKKGAL